MDIESRACEIFRYVKGFYHPKITQNEFVDFIANLFMSIPSNDFEPIMDYLQYLIYDARMNPIPDGTYDYIFPDIIPFYPTLYLMDEDSDREDEVFYYMFTDKKESLFMFSCVSMISIMLLFILGVFTYVLLKDLHMFSGYQNNEL